jgi:hypothetical protein
LASLLLTLILKQERIEGVVAYNTSRFNLDSVCFREEDVDDAMLFGANVQVAGSFADDGQQKTPRHRVLATGE